MPREKDCFRAYLERLDERFPKKEILTQKDCAEFLGKNKKTIKTRYGIDARGISKVKLARLLS